LSLERLREHREIWAGKPVLQDVYAVWFQAILAHAAQGARVIEIGAGPGLFREWARAHRPDLRWMATDLLAAPWNDVAADATALPVRSGAVDLVIGIDVLHHLADPRALFAEAARVTVPGGRLVLIEPWISPLSYPVYRLAHEEGCTLGIDPWRPFASGSSKDAFEGDQAVPWKIVRSTGHAEWHGLGLSAPAVTTLNGFAYLPTLGFRRGSLLPRWLTRPLLWGDRVLAGLSRWLGMRALVSWERREGAAPPRR
jgi:SAM-dependent methyltransferase